MASLHAADVFLFAVFGLSHFGRSSSARAIGDSREAWQSLRRPSLEWCKKKHRMATKLHSAALGRPYSCHAERWDRCKIAAEENGDANEAQCWFDFQRDEVPRVLVHPLLDSKGNVISGSAAVFAPEKAYLLSTQTDIEGLEIDAEAAALTFGSFREGIPEEETK